MMYCGRPSNAIESSPTTYTHCVSKSLKRFDISYMVLVWANLEYTPITSLHRPLTICGPFDRYVNRMIMCELIRLQHLRRTEIFERERPYEFGVVGWIKLEGD